MVGVLPVARDFILRFYPEQPGQEPGQQAACWMGQERRDLAVLGSPGLSLGWGRFESVP